MSKQLLRFFRRLAKSFFLAGFLALPVAGQTIYGLEFSYGLYMPSLLSFTATDPGAILVRTAITGVASGETLVGLDFRPSTGELFGLGYDVSTQTGRLYVLNLTTAVATPLGAAIALPLGSGGSLSNQGGITPRISLAFDPTTDRVRVCSSTTQANLLLHPATGNLVATDTPFAYAAGDANASTTASLGTIAYTSSYSGGPATSLYAINEQTYYLTSIVLPASGEVRTVRSLRPTSTPAYTPYPSYNYDLDFYYDPTTGTDVGYLSFSGVDPASGYASLRKLDMDASSTSITIGPFGGYYEVRDIAVQPAGVITATHNAELAVGLALAPNPIGSSTRLSFSIPRAAHVELIVLDALGRPVDKLDAGLLPAGTQALIWRRRQQAAGIYFFSLHFDGRLAGTCRGVLIE
jgi:hypothetical protein